MNSINQIFKIISYYFFLVTKKWVEKGNLSWFLSPEETSKALSTTGFKLGTSTSQTLRSEPIIIRPTTPMVLVTMRFIYKLIK